MFSYCNIEENNGVTTIVFFKNPKIGEIKKVIDQLAVDHSYHLRVWDFSDVLFDYSIDEMLDAVTYSKTKYLEKNRFAIVTPQELDYGLVKALMAIQEEDNNSVPMVFKTKAEALVWIEEQREELNTD